MAAEETIDTDFSFAYLRYPCVKITEHKKVAIIQAEKAGRNLVYFNRDIRCGRKLILAAESFSPNTNHDWSLIVGVTTCDPSQVFHFPYHVVDCCRYDNDCGGISLSRKIFHMEKCGDFLVVERIFDAFIRITVNGRHKIHVSDPPERGFGRKRRTYPFLMLNGKVAAVRILAEVPKRNTPIPPSVMGGGTCSSPMDNNLISGWAVSRHIAVDGLVLRRKSSVGANRNYVFNSKPFLIGKCISFVVRDWDKVTPGTITFGVTTHKPDTISLQNLPINSNELIANRFNTYWFVSQDMIDPLSRDRCFTIKRTPSGISLKPAGQKPKFILTHVDPTLVVYPFFNFNGGISTIELIRNSAAIFVMTTVGRELQTIPDQRASTSSSRPRSNPSSDEGKCVICRTLKADHMAVPCNHVALCNSCSTQIMTSDQVKCPLCRTPITRICKIFLA